MSMRLKVDVVVGIRLAVSAIDAIYDCPDLEHEPYGLALWYDDDTAENPVLGKSLAHADEYLPSQIRELGTKDHNVIAAQIRELGFDASPEDIKTYFVAYWG